MTIVMVKANKQPSQAQDFLFCTWQCCLPNLKKKISNNKQNSIADPILHLFQKLELHVAVVGRMVSKDKMDCNFVSF